MPRLRTIPHAPIKRTTHATGQVDELDPGSYVNLAAASQIIADGRDVVVEIPGFEWRFTLPDADEAREWVEKLTQWANG